MINENIKYIEHCLKFINPEDKDIIGFMEEQLNKWRKFEDEVIGTLVIIKGSPSVTLEELIEAIEDAWLGDSNE